MYLSLSMIKLRWSWLWCYQGHYRYRFYWFHFIWLVISEDSTKRESGSKVHHANIRAAKVRIYLNLRLGFMNAGVADTVILSLTTLLKNIWFMVILNRSFVSLCYSCMHVSFVVFHQTPALLANISFPLTILILIYIFFSGFSRLCFLCVFVFGEELCQNSISSVNVFFPCLLGCCGSDSDNIGSTLNVKDAPWCGRRWYTLLN